MPDFDAKEGLIDRRADCVDSRMPMPHDRLAHVDDAVPRPAPRIAELT